MILVQLAQRNVTGIQWVASEAWVTASLLTSPNFHPLLEGTLGFSFPGVRIPGLEEFLLGIRPSPYPGMAFVNMFWEELFGCRLKFTPVTTNRKEKTPLNEFMEQKGFGYKYGSQNYSVSAAITESSTSRESPEDTYRDSGEKPECSGREDLRHTDSSYTDVSQVRISYNVYKAVYAIAHALHALLNCDSAGDKGNCDKHKVFTSRQVI